MHMVVWVQWRHGGFKPVLAEPVYLTFRLFTFVMESNLFGFAFFMYLFHVPGQTRSIL